MGRLLYHRFFSTPEMISRRWQPSISRLFSAFSNSLTEDSVSLPAGLFRQFFNDAVPFLPLRIILSTTAFQTIYTLYAITGEKRFFEITTCGTLNQSNALGLCLKHILEMSNWFTSVT